MSILRKAVAAAAFLVLASGATPGRADSLGLWLDPIVGPFTYGPSTVLYYGEPQDLSSPDWYKHWLFLRRNSSNGALYNEPCTMSQGYRERTVPCQLVALAESPPGAPIIVDGGPGPALEAAPYRRRHRHAGWVRARY
jgi:hypothetical protein